MKLAELFDVTDLVTVVTVAAASATPMPKLWLTMAPALRRENQRAAERALKFSSSAPERTPES